MNKFTEIFNRLIDQSFGQISGFCTHYGPAVIFALMVIFIGWVLAVLIRKVTAKLLRALGFDILMEKTGLSKILERGEIDTKPSVIAGWSLYWLVLINTLFMAQDALDLKLTVDFMNNIFGVFPNMVVVVILLSLGFYVGNTISRLAEKTALLANIPLAKFIGIMSRYVVVGVSVMMSIDVLSAASRIVVDSFVVIFIIIPLLLLLILLRGGRDVITNVLDGRFAREMFSKGDVIEIDGISGEVIDIGAVSTLLSAADGEVVIPNSELSKKIIRRKKIREHPEPRQ